jgi:GNAT superfamily N-acetyltransferase
MRSGRLTPRLGMRSRVSLRSTRAWGSAAAGAPGSIRASAGPRAKRAPWKERLVREGDAHAALVFDGDAAVAWCQYGSPDELPNIHHRKEYEATRTDEPPDYRITCIFVDRDYRRKGVAGVALRGALDLIAKAGGGVVEGYPQDTQGKKISASFLYNTTRSLYEQTGFSYDRPKGKNHCVMRRTVSPAKKPRRARAG